MPDRPIVKCMLDSGAYSAWRLNKHVDMDAYCAFLERNHDWITQYVNMDEILPHDVETAGRVSFENLVEMRRRGFEPIPVFHVGETLDYLDRMLDLGCDYIGISTTSARGAAIDHFLDLAWSKLVTPDGEPIVKVHAFGNSKVETLLKYPWASADSSSWLRGQKFGKILLPGAILNHRHSTAHETDVFYEGLDERVLHTRQNQDIEFLSGEDLALVQGHLKDLNLDLDTMLDARQGRRTWLTHSYIAATYFIKLEQRINDMQPILFKPVGGFVTGNGSSLPAIKLDGFDLYMAIGACPSTLPAMQFAGGYKPLASFYYTSSEMAANRMRTYFNDPVELMAQQPFAKYTDLLQEIVG